ncbi:MAG: argininosuccinate synthase [Oligoflexales bacterium]
MTSKKLILAYSGGLDTTYCAKLLCEQGYEVHTVTVNTGGFSADELSEIEKNAYELGVARHSTIDATKEFYEKCVKYLVYGNVLRNNTYPLCVSAERAFQALEIAKFAKDAGAKYIAHGCTGAGNDQVRFDMVFSIVCPEVTIITPIRDTNVARATSKAYLKEHGIVRSWSEHEYSINKGLWGTSIGGKETLVSDQMLPEKAFAQTVQNVAPFDILLHFTKGELTGINEQTNLGAVETIRKLTEIAEPLGIGRDIHVGDTIIGLKGRVGFEAPAPMIILKAHEGLEKHTLTKSQIQLKANLSLTYGAMIHEGFYLEPALRDIERFLENSQRTVTGSVRVRLAPYRFQVIGVSSANDLMRKEFGVYGESNQMWTSDDAKGFTKILGNSLSMYYKVNPNEKN